MDLLQTARNLLETRVEKQRICAITTFKGRITGIAVNSYSKTHPEQKRLATKVGHSYKEYLHAEVLALLRASKVDSIHVFRLGRNGEWLNATPCTICQLAIKERNVSRVFHT